VVTLALEHAAGGLEQLTPPDPLSFGDRGADCRRNRALRERVRRLNRE